MHLVKLFIDAIFFLLAVFVLIYLPGFLVVKKTGQKWDEAEKLVYSLSLGIVFLVLLSLITNFFKIRWLFLPSLLILAVFTLKKFGSEARAVFNFKKWPIKKKNFFVILMVVGVLVQIWINVFSGWEYKEGIKFWSSHGHDSFWHGSLMQEVKKGFPLEIKFLSGEKLKNYHYFVDVLMGEFFRIFGFNPFDLYFRFFTFIFAFLFLLNSFVLVRDWQGENSALWAMFFLIFSGSFGYFLTLKQNRNLIGSEARFWVSQGNTAIGNPPQIAAFILFLAFLGLFFRWLKKPNSFLLLCLSMLGGLMIGFKVYAGATILAGLLLTGLWQAIFQKRYDVLKVFLVVLLPAIWVFKKTASGGGSFLVWQPFWFVRTMVVSGDRLAWMDLELRRQFYLAQKSITGYLRVFQFEFLALLIFTVGNLGTKVLGFLEVARKFFSKNKPVLFDLFLIFCLITSFVFPHFFVQKGVAWNTVQFFQYFILLMAFFAGAAWEKMISGFKMKKVVACFGFLFIFSVPTVLGNLIFFSPRNALAIVEKDELRALEFLKKETPKEAVIATVPFDSWAWEHHPSQPRPIYVWDSTGYVSYFSDRSTYVTDEGQVEILRYPQGKERVLELNKYLFGEGHARDKDKKPQVTLDYLSKSSLDYIYLVYNQKLIFPPEKIGLEEVFENRVARIYRIKR